MLQLFPDLCYHMGAIRKMGGYQRVKMSRRLSEGGIVVGGGGVPHFSQSLSSSGRDTLNINYVIYIIIIMDSQTKTAFI